MPIQDFVSSLTDNPYFSAGFGLFGVGAGAAVLRKGYMLGLIMFRRHYMTTLEVPCRDKSYQWLLQWITLRGAKKTQHLSVETTFQQIETGRITTRHDFIPSVGEHFFWYRGTWIRIERARSQQTLDLHMGIPFENLKLTTIGKNKDLFLHILTEARDLAVKQNEGKTIMYTAYGSEWRQFGNPRKPRPLTSVILDEGISERILKDVQDFMNNPEWYSNRGIPYRRGYLLHGPPGCGKSSFITALAGELQLGICVLNLSERGLTDDRLNHLLALAPENTIILLEDIDSAFANREETAEVKAAYAGMNRLTFSGLLNCLDGVASSEARMVFMTTNYPERLDPALVRPGRVDLKEYIGHCTPHQLVTMYRRFYPETPVESAFSFSEVVRDLKVPVSAAAVQGHFMQHKEDPLGALDNSSSLNHVLQRYKSHWNIDVCLKPVLLAGIIKTIGTTAEMLQPRNLHYHREDMRRCSKYFNVPLKLSDGVYESVIGKGTLLPSRFLTAVDLLQPSLLESTSRELWVSAWSKHEDISSAEVVAAAGLAAGLTPEALAEVKEHMHHPTTKQRLKAYTDEAVEHGAFGVPTILTHQGPKSGLFFGSDRFHLIAKEIDETWVGPEPDAVHAKL